MPGFLAHEVHERLRYHRKLLADGIDEIPVTRDRETFHVESDQTVVLGVEPEGVTRHDRYPEAGEDRLRDCLVRGKLHADHWFFAVRLEDLLATMRVPEPGSRMRYGSRAKRSNGIFFCCARG